VIRYEKYGRNPRYGKCGRKGRMNCEMIWKI
jgi:hypothetical protein